MSGKSYCSMMEEPQLLDMSPPPYPDLGKRAKDVFSKGYHFGLLKLDCKTKTSSGVEFTSGGNSNQEDGKVSGFLETKYNVKDYGLTFSEKWTTDNKLGTEISIKDQIVQGLKLGVELTFSPQSGDKTAKVKTAFTNPYLALNLDGVYDPNGPEVTGSLVLGHKGWAAGARGVFDINNSKLKKSGIAIGFSTTDFVLHTNVEISDDGKQFGGSIYQKITPKLESGIDIAWQVASNETKIGIGANYTIDPEASIRAKVNNLAQLGLGYQQRLREGVTLTLSALIDGKNFNEGGHKIGLALELEG